MDSKGLLRWHIFNKIFDGLTEEEKRTFIYLSMQGRDHREIMEALRMQGAQIDRMVEKVEKQSWFNSFGSDIAANILTDGLIWLGSKLFRR